MPETASTEPIAPTVESPPLTPMPARESVPDPRAELYRLAHELVRGGNRRLLIEYLRLRRTIR